VTNYTDYTLTEAIEAVKARNLDEAYRARQAALEAAIVDVDLTVAEYFLSRAEAARTRVYGYLAPRMPEVAAPQENQPVALQSAPAHYSDPDLADIYSDNGNDPFDVPRYLKGATR
jgi:hypothetical protein